MSSRHLEPYSRQLTIIIGLTVVGFMAFGLTLSFYRNVLFERTLLELEEKNQQLKSQIDQGYKDLEYYKSYQYKDKYAKESLGKVRPGENVLIIPPSENLREEHTSELTPSEEREIRYLELLRQMPTLDHWKMFLFYPKKIEELKKGA